MHSKPWELSARALEILWACHFPSQLSEKRSIWIPRVCTLEEEGRKKACWNRKRKSKNDGTYRQQGSDTSAEVYVCWCGACCFCESGGLTSLSGGEACARMKWQRLYAPSYHPAARVRDPSLSCKEKNAQCGERVGRAGGWGKGRRGGGGMTEWQDDSSSAWHIFHLITPKL